MDNQMIPKLCGNLMTPYMTYSDCDIGLYTVLFADGTFVINLSKEQLLDYELKHGAIVQSFDPFLDQYDYIFISPEDRPWNDYVESITAIEVANEITPTDMSYWFWGMENALTADVSLIDTSQTKYMMYTFAYCKSLEVIDLSAFDTENLITPYLMFFRCDSVNEINLSNWTFNNNTKYAWYEDYWAINRTIKNVSTFIVDNVDTSNVTDMSDMFNGFAYVSTLDLSSFDTSNVTDMAGMFHRFGEDVSDAALDLSMFDTSKVEYMNWMFASCVTLVSLDISSFDTSNVVDMEDMFIALQSIEDLSLCSFSSESLEYAAFMFAFCSALKTIYTTPSFNLAGVDGIDMFRDSSNLVGGNGTVYDAEYYGIERAKIDGGVGNEGYFTAC